MPSARRLQEAARADPVGADPLLHPADDLALGPDREQRHHAPGTTKIADDLDQDRATSGSWPKSRQRAASARRRAALTPGAIPRSLGRPGRRAPAPSVARGPRSPREFVGSQTTRSGMSVDHAAGSGDRAAVGGDRDLVAVGHARPRPRSRPTAGRRRAARCRPGTARRPAGGRRRAASCQVASTRLARAAARGCGRAGGRSAPAAASPAPGAERGELARAAAAASGRPEVRRPSRRRARPAPASGSDRGHAQRGARTAAAGPPSSRTCRPSRRPRRPAARRRRAR